MTAVDGDAPCSTGSSRAQPWLAWAIFLVVISAIVIASPLTRTVTPNYREACLRWFAGQDIYCEGPHGFLYFPHAAALFAPFAFLPFGDVLWRVFGIGGLALAVWRLACTIAPRSDQAKAFAWTTALAIPPALASARNGQMNLVLVSSMTFALVAIAARRWNRAAFWLCFGLAMKPLTIVPLVVAGCCYRALWKPLAVGALLVAAFPFLTQAPAYVMRQHLLCGEKLLLAASPGRENPASDLFGLLHAVGLDLSANVQTASRAAAVIALALFCHAAVARRQRRAASVILLTFLGCYLTLFNPRAENNGYVVLVPALAAWVAWGLPGERQRSLRWLMAVVSFGIAGSYELSHGPNFWLNPLLALAPLSLAVASVVGRSPLRRDSSAMQAPCVCFDLPAAATTPAVASDLRAPDHDLTLVIPAFNEERRLPRTLDALVKSLDQWGIDYRVVVVDDASDDGTATVSRSYGPRVQTISLLRRGGKGQAVKSGMLAATGRVIAFTDADLPYSLEDLRSAYEAIAAGTCAAAFGARDLAGSSSAVPTPRLRHVASTVFRMLTRWLVSRRVADTQCGLKAFSAEAARAIFTRTTIAGFAFDVEVVWLCERLGIALERIPVTLLNDYDSSLSVVRDGAAMFLEVLRFRFLRRPMAVQLDRAEPGRLSPHFLRDPQESPIVPPSLSATALSG